MENRIISDHLFVFPFSWRYWKFNNDELFHQHTQLVHKRFEKLGHWTIHYSTIDNNKAYNEYVYFYKPIRMALYSFKNEPVVVRNYVYERLDETSCFVIIKDEQEYILDISQIDLKLYKTGIGLLSFRIKNTKYEKISDIEAINSFSQCIYPPMLPMSGAREIGLPEEIKIQLNKNTVIKEKFNDNYFSEKLSISPIIMKVLGEPFCIRNEYHHKNRIMIEAVLGNQLYCICTYYNKELLNSIYNDTTDTEVLSKLMTNNKRTNALQEIEKITGENDSSYLKCTEHLYGVNRFMLLCITKEEEHDKLYDQLVKLTLMQRATLLNFSSELARISTVSKYELPPAILSIYEIYIQFINQLYFKEVTQDPEGSYIYEQLSKAFKIQEELDQLDHEIEEVHEYANLVDQSSSSFKMQLLTIIGAALVLPEFMTGFFGMNIFQKEAVHWWSNRNVLLWMNSYVFLPMVIVIELCIWNRRKNTWSILFRIGLLILAAVSMFFAIRNGCGL